MVEPSRGAQIAHVLFLDVVGYSKESLSTQGQILAQLNAAVNGAAAFQECQQHNDVLPIPTGDGMALLFFLDVLAPARCAVEIQRRLSGLPVRMGIHSGLVQRQLDILGKENVVGEGINTAFRVMGFGDAGHILVSTQYALFLGQFESWKPALHLVGDGTTKHNLQLQFHSLYGEGFGNPELPTALIAARVAEVVPRESRVPAQKVVLLYKRNLPEDERVLRLLETHLAQNGHEVFVDKHLRIGVEWARAIEDKIRAADAVVAIVSPKAMQSEMLEFEIETAVDQYQKVGKPVLLPVRIGTEDLDGAVAAAIKPLNYFQWTGAEDESRLVVELLSAIHEPLKPPPSEVKLEPVGGAVPPGSPFYIPRSTDPEFLRALDDRESILLVRGARQMGKTSLLAQGNRHVRERGWRLAVTDFQKLNMSQLADEESFYKLVAATLARQLKFSYDFDSEWDGLFGSNLNMENFLQALLECSDEPLVWSMDEVDKLFLAPFASDFFGLVRSWHNARSIEPGGPWSKLTVVISYATEAHLFIQDLNQSPFNVGRRIDLADFNLQQLVDLNGRYGSPLHSYQEVERLQNLVSGQPFLCRRALDSVATRRYDFDGLMEHAVRDDGPFGDHLKRILISVSRLPAVLDYVKAVLQGENPSDQDTYYRLLASGVVRPVENGSVKFRCGLYRDYLNNHCK